MYEQIARFYDLTHAQLTEDIPFILETAAGLVGPVLELGCGTGRLLLPLARNGKRVIGVDSSAGMLDRARRRLAALTAPQAARVSLLQADMRNLSLAPPAGQPFGLVLLPYNTAMHLRAGGLGEVLQRVREWLGEDGRFVIDVANPFHVAGTPNDRMLTLEKVLTDPESGDAITQLASNWLDDEAQTLHITWLYDQSPAGGGPLQRTVVQAVYHYLFPHQWQLLLGDNGFRVANMVGNYDRASFTEESPRLILILQKG